MKTLDKPTNSQSDNLLNIKEKPSASFKVSSVSKLSKILVIKTSFLWLTVFKIARIRIHIHQTTKKNNMVEGELP